MLRRIFRAFLGLPTPKDTPRVELPVITKEKRSSAEQRKLEQRVLGQRERAKGASKGRERLRGKERVKKFTGMDLRQWMEVGLFLLQRTMCFLNPIAFDSDLRVVETILEEDGVVEGKGRAALANSFEATRKEWEGYLDKDGIYETRLSEKERMIGGL
ncbi:hypothetical protein L211DRAFT_486994 [Terfezia boudieri ATCC MYA-4762]|uniref:Uncharacterized protein n=1 Tax=Terfezia boudieri ATCC MYA-4762 TaxID=1051890 RepID=A0A3N4LYZ5_9PEZI|nr:hypothetical protein L211DRAFT_486994 [Terfezia boudieri ATCC MYA-4762]